MFYEYWRISSVIYEASKCASWRSIIMIYIFTFISLRWPFYFILNSNINIIQLEWIFKIAVPHPKESASKLPPKIPPATPTKPLQRAATINKTMILLRRIHSKLQNNPIEARTSTVHPNDLYVKKQTLVSALPPSPNKTQNQKIAIINPYNNVN